MRGPVLPRGAIRRRAIGLDSLRYSFAPDIELVMRQLALSAACVMAALGHAAAEPSPAGETTYVERSLNRSGTLVVEHPPVARNPSGRRDGRAAIAGFCREGGLIRRLDASGRSVIVRQREVCDSVAPRTLSPGEVDPRPAWPADAVAQRILRSKG